MIKFGTIGLTLSVEVARALLAFASQDGSRRELCGIGIDEGDLCATDGHAAVRFERVDIDGGAAAPTRWNRRVFARAKVEAAIKAAKGSGGAVVLQWSELESEGIQFAQLSKAEPKDGVREDDLPIAWNPALLGRLELAAKACRRDRLPGEQGPPDVPGVILTSLGGYMDPCRYSIGGEYWDTAVHAAFVTIMPMNMRAKGALGDSLAVERCKEAAEKKRIAEKRKDEKRKLAAIERERTKAAREEAKRVRARDKAQRAVEA